MSISKVVVSKFCDLTEMKNNLNLSSEDLLWKDSIVSAFSTTKMLFSSKLSIVLTKAKSCTAVGQFQTGFDRSRHFESEITSHCFLTDTSNSNTDGITGVAIGFKNGSVYFMNDKLVYVMKLEWTSEEPFTHIAFNSDQYRKLGVTRCYLRNSVVEVVSADVIEDALNVNFDHLSLLNDNSNTTRIYQLSSRLFLSVCLFEQKPGADLKFAFFADSNKTCSKASLFDYFCSPYQKYDYSKEKYSRSYVLIRKNKEFVSTNSSYSNSSYIDRIRPQFIQEGQKSMLRISINNWKNNNSSDHVECSLKTITRRSHCLLKIDELTSGELPIIATSAAISPDETLIAIVTSIGCIFIYNINRGIILRILKGYRDGQIAWTRTKTNIVAQILLIYAPRRGILEAWPSEHGQRLDVINLDKHDMILSTSSLTNQQAIIFSKYDMSISELEINNYGLYICQDNSTPYRSVDSILAGFRTLSKGTLDNDSLNRLYAIYAESTADNQIMILQRIFLSGSVCTISDDGFLCLLQMFDRFYTEKLNDRSNYYESKRLLDILHSLIYLCEKLNYITLEHAFSLESIKKRFGEFLQDDLFEILSINQHFETAINCEFTLHSVCQCFRYNYDTLSLLSNDTDKFIPAYLLAIDSLKSLNRWIMSIDCIEVTSIQTILCGFIQHINPRFLPLTFLQDLLNIDNKFIKSLVNSFRMSYDNHIQLAFICLHLSDLSAQTEDWKRKGLQFMSIFIINKLTKCRISINEMDTSLKGSLTLKVVEYLVRENLDPNILTSSSNIHDIINASQCFLPYSLSNAALFSNLIIVQIDSLNDSTKLDPIIDTLQLIESSSVRHICTLYLYDKVVHPIMSKFASAVIKGRQCPSPSFLKELFNLTRSDIKMIFEKAQILLSDLSKYKYCSYEVDLLIQIEWFWSRESYSDDCTTDNELLVANHVLSCLIQQNCPISDDIIILHQCFANLLSIILHLNLKSIELNSLFEPDILQRSLQKLSISPTICSDNNAISIDCQFKRRLFCDQITNALFTRFSNYQDVLMWKSKVFEIAQQLGIEMESVRRNFIKLLFAYCFDEESYKDCYTTLNKELLAIELTNIAALRTQYLLNANMIDSQMINKMSNDLQIWIGSIEVVGHIVKCATVQQTHRLFKFIAENLPKSTNLSKIIEEAESIFNLAITDFKNITTLSETFTDKK
ncbi:hypothetical protein GJ496_000832 [Pomphorhynchus laevis]|nr:hypothetical protein GJ496_000832 [Pomphorhynchus laevis]